MSEHETLMEGRWCFVCGEDNPAGLRTTWRLTEDGRARTSFVPTRQQEGWRGIVHGGILAALCDEAMAQRLRLAGIRAVTATLTVRYLKPVPVGASLIVEGELLEERSRACRLRASILDPDGTCYAQADALCVRR